MDRNANRPRKQKRGATMKLNTRVLIFLVVFAAGSILWTLFSWDFDTRVMYVVEWIILVLLSSLIAST